MEKVTCTKRKFYSKRETKQFIKKSNGKLHPYMCTHCNKWHATKQTQIIDTLCNQKDINKNEKTLVHMIQSENKSAYFLRRLSKKKTAWEILLDNKKYNVIYNRKQKTIELTWKQ